MYKLLLLLVFSFQLFISYSQQLIPISDSVSVDTISVLLEKINEYKLRYKVNCVQDKITDNQGNGFEELYGTRNFRVVLSDGTEINNFIIKRMIRKKIIGKGR